MKHLNPISSRRAVLLAVSAILLSASAAMAGEAGSLPPTRSSPASGEPAAASFIPEPSAALLGAVGLICLLRRRRVDLPKTVPKA